MSILRGHARTLALVASCLVVAACTGSACAAGPREREGGGAPPQARSTPEVPNLKAEASRPRIVALGDSLTIGLGLLESQSYPARLQKNIDADGYNFEVENAGVSGDTSAGGLRRLDWAIQGDVRILIVALGANDALRGLSVAEMKSNLSAIIERARSRGITVILAGMEAPPNYGQEYAVAFRQAYQDLAHQHRVLFVPFLLDKVAGVPELNQADGIHPNERGAQIVADTLWKVLKPLLAQITADS